MIFCCKDFGNFLCDEQSSDNPIIWFDESDGKYYIAKDMSIADDGGGHTDSWANQKEKINYWPFCGRSLL